MDWTNTAHIVQAIYWTLLCCLFLNGYSVGARGIV